MSTIFITGVSSGIGEALAYVYARKKYTIGICARRIDTLNKIADTCKELGGKMYVYKLDVQNQEQCNSIARDFLESTSGIDYVIANAGIGGDDGLYSGSGEIINKILKTNIMGVTNTVMPFIPKMKEQKHGTIVCISSVASYMPLPFHGGYASSKIAIRMIFDSWRPTLQRHNIKTITICPGFIDTPMVKGPARKFPMKSSADAANKFFKIIQTGKKSTYIYPWHYKILIWINRLVPEKMYNFFIRKMFHKPIN